jgi:CRP-like cAMP-binding protein
LAPSTLGLRTFDLFDSLTPQKLDALAQQCGWRSFESGQRIISRQAADRDVYFLVGGRVRVTAYSADGRQVTFTDVASGEIFGDLAAIDDQPRSADVLALDHGLVACLPAAAFRRLIAEEPLVASRVLQRLVNLVRRLSGRVFDLSTLAVRNRIHSELLRLAREAGVARNRARIEPAPRHADIAAQVSTYREQVTRELSALAKAGVVGKQDQALLVLDVTRLERLVRDVGSAAQGRG